MRRETAVRAFALSMVLLLFGTMSVAEARFIYIRSGGYPSNSSASEFGSACGTIVGVLLGIIIIVFAIRAVTEMAGQSRGRRERSRRRTRQRRRDYDDDDDDWQPRRERSVR